MALLLKRLTTSFALALPPAIDANPATFTDSMLLSKKPTSPPSSDKTWCCSCCSTG
ncbi:hypothetical protein PR003_g11914 [Phytophthora rubi]|uniref:RxLR effector protein n=1 Tax=Phytophthora rubi TaxID=129364 RepID=A0A6A3M046_9STRA|nr:hypothetical protein PR002_g11720 [Phytophthora rubi]KAE9337635.1 hypothetical protein PR003_g11914 [Phytophthora rubi]